MNRGVKLLLLLGIVGAVVWWAWAGREAPDAVAVAEDRAGPAGAAALTGPRGGPELPALKLKDTKGTIAGKVFDPQGAPVAGAQVCTYGWSPFLGSADTRDPVCTKTNKDGSYRLEGLWPIRQRVSAMAPGFIATRYERGEGVKRRDTVDLRPGAEVRGIDIRLKGGGVEIKGHVRDLSGGSVAGAIVGVDEAVTYADAEGAFTMWVKPGGVNMWARADGYASGNDEGLAPGHVFEVFLMPEAVIVGKVVRAGDGAPIEGAKVEAIAGEGWGSGQTAFTDAGGNFRIDELEPGAYKAKATAEDAMGKSNEQVVLGMGETSEPQVIEAHPAFTIEGRIVTEAGEACDLGSLNARDRANDRGGWQEADPDGLVRMEGLLPGEYAIELSCRGFVSAEKYEPVKIVDASVTGVKWVVEAGGTIRGVVVDDAGKPVPDLRLSAGPKSDPGKPRARQTSAWGGETDEAGVFELGGLLPGTYEVSVNNWSANRAVPDKPTEVTLTAGKDAEVKITLPATAELRGRVRDSNGKPVKKATVSLSGGTQWTSVNAADDGSFVIEHAPPGEYRVIARQGWDLIRTPGTRDDDPQGVKVSLAAGAKEKIELVVEDLSGTITGTVQAEGGPVGDALVEATRESESAAAASGGGARDTRWLHWYKTPEMTDQDGKFTLTGLAPGKYTLRAHRNGGGEALKEHVAVGAEVELTIALPGSLAGTVKVRGGDAPEEFRVNVIDEATGYRRADTFFRTRGAWRIPEVPQGKFKVTAAAGEGSQELEVVLDEGEAKTDVRFELAPKVTVRGTVVDLEGKPVPGMRVMVGAASGGMFAWGGEDEKQHITDDRGHFEVPRAPVGKVEVYVMPRNWGATDEYGWTSVPAVLADAGPVVELPPIRVAKKRVKEEEVAGDLGYRVKEEEPGADPAARQLVVAVVRPGGPASAAGLQIGDVITQVDGHDVGGVHAYLHDTLTQVLAGTQVTLGLARGASVQVTAGKKP